MTDADTAHKLQIVAYRRQSRLAMRKAGQLVPENTVAGNALTVVVAIMSFLACLTLGAVTLVRDASRDWQSDIQREITIQVRPIEGVDAATEAAKAASIARQSSGVASVKVLDQAENAKLLEPWLGTGLDLGRSAHPAADRRAAVRSVGGRPQGAVGERSPAACAARHSTITAAGRRACKTMANATVIIGISILALVFVATILSVVFATRGAMATNHDIVSVLHFVGAEDGFIAREFQRHFLLLGLRGGLAGAAVAALLFAVLSFIIAPVMASPETDQVAALFGRFAVGPIGYFGALGIAFLIALMTAVTSRLTVYRYLADSD